MKMLQNGDWVLVTTKGDSSKGWREWLGHVVILEGRVFPETRLHTVLKMSNAAWTEATPAAAKRARELVERGVITVPRVTINLSRKKPRHR
jgi:hypothetical protein